MKPSDILASCGMSDKELGQKVGISRPHASKLRRGVRGITPDMAKRLEAVTGIPAERLIFGDPA